MGVLPYPNLDGLPAAGDERVRASEPLSVVEGVEAGEDQSSAAVGERPGRNQATGVVEVGKSIDVTADCIGRERFGPNSPKSDLDLHAASLGRPVRGPARNPAREPPSGHSAAGGLEEGVDVHRAPDVVVDGGAAEHRDDLHFRAATYRDLTDR